MPSESNSATIGKLKYNSNHNHGPSASTLDPAAAGESSSLLHPRNVHITNTATNRDVSLSGSIFDQAADAIAEREAVKRRKQIIRFLGLFWAIVNCLCAGSLTTYSLYSGIFLRRLHYSQYQVNGLSIAGEVALYLPVPVSGYLCDRYGPGRPSIGAGILSGIGYLVAAFTYRSGGSYPLMLTGFILAGTATSAMYLSAVTCCVKNFGRGANKGLTLALPIAAFGLSGMWLSQFASHVLPDRSAEARPGDINVFWYFVFLASVLLGSGLIGGALLQVVDEDELIEEAVEDLANSGVLDESALFRHHRSRTHSTANSHSYTGGNGYGAIGSSLDNGPSDEDENVDDTDIDISEKKQWLLGEETRLFLRDKTMWYLLIGFFFVTGPGESFINNVGTLIETLAPTSDTLSRPSTNPATHVSIIAIASTIARVASGSLSDLLAPKVTTHGHMTSSFASLPPRRFPSESNKGISRVTFLLLAATLMALSQILTASGLFQSHPGNFWIISALLGAGYGATFSLTPIIISVVWGVENFGTNWGIVAIVPAGGATMWGLIYSAVFEQAAHWEGGRSSCVGTKCYVGTFWAMSASTFVAMAFWFLAWKGPGGWKRRGIEL